MDKNNNYTDRNEQKYVFLGKIQSRVWMRETNYRQLLVGISRFYGLHCFNGTIFITTRWLIKVPFACLKLETVPSIKLVLIIKCE